MLDKNKFRVNKFKIYLWVASLILVTFFTPLDNNHLTGFTLPVYASEITPAKILELTNQSRVAEDLPALTFSSELAQAAQSKAQDMFLYDYFAHTSPQGIDPWYWIREVGYDYEYAGENLAMDFLSAEAVHQALIDSAAHRKNILNSHYKEIGIAVLAGEFEGRTATIVVEMFGSSLPVRQTGILSGAEKETEISQDSLVLSSVLDSASQGASSDKLESSDEVGEIGEVEDFPSRESSSSFAKATEDKSLVYNPKLQRIVYNPKLQRRIDSNFSLATKESFNDMDETILVPPVKLNFSDLPTREDEIFLDICLEKDFLIKLNEEGVPACPTGPEKNGIIKGNSGWDQNSKNFIAINFLKNFNRSNLAFTFLFLYLWIGFCTVFEGVIKEL